MAYFEDSEVERLAECIEVTGGDEVAGTTAKDQAFRRLLAAMMLACSGAGECSNCTLGGLGICIFETGNEPPPAPCLAKTAV